MKEKTKNMRMLEEKNIIKKIQKSKTQKGITLVALVITIVLNCLCSGRKLEYTA